MRIKDLDIYISDGNYSSKYPRSDEFVENGIPFIRANNLINGDISDYDMYFITEEKHSILLKGHVKSGDVLITTRGNIGQVAIVPERHNDSNINAQLVLLRTNPDRIYNRYLLWALQSYHAQKQILELQTGSTLKQLPVGRLEQIKIKLFELSVQRQIAANLDKVTHTIDLCNAILEKLDLLVKSRFVEMFGEPVSDSKQWGQKPLSDMLESIRYGTSTPPEFSSNGYAFIRATNIKNGKIIDKDMKYISQKEAEKLEKCKLSGGEIIIVRSGVNAGDTCVITEKYRNQYAGYDMILVLNDKLNPIFLNELINTAYMEKIVKPLTRRAAQPHLNSEQTKSFPIICVPIELQNNFAAFVEQTDKSRSAVKKLLEKAETLKKALMQEYFG